MPYVAVPLGVIVILPDVGLFCPDVTHALSPSVGLQAVAPGADQVRVTDCPGEIVEAEALKETGTKTFNAVMFDTVPLGPEHIMVKLGCTPCFVITVSVPDVVFVPDHPPEAIQLVVLVDDQLTVAG